MPPGFLSPQHRGVFAPWRQSAMGDGEMLLGGEEKRLCPCSRSLRLRLWRLLDTYSPGLSVTENSLLWDSSSDSVLNAT